MKKEKILLLACSQTMDDICVACSRCMVAFNRREGAFAGYEDSAELIGILGCGGCPGQGVVMRMSHLQLWNAPLEEAPTRVHIAPCLLQHCPHKDTLMAKIRAKAGVEVIDGGHPYQPQAIFG